ncbi:transcriptional regulator of sulfur amino acid metabolism [Sporothrix stenoceras]|uniref:Transcriptional regulator of sulfur amino acid metabolism n=1 Tax=Sporothrix stenoceras TaxID=5173 RepID=A0ABR3YTQ1_9PEZI
MDQQHDQHYQQTQRHSQDFSASRGPLSSQPRSMHDNGSGSNNNRDSTGVAGSSMNYRSHPSPSPGLGMNSFSSKLGGGIHHNMPNQSPFQMYNPQPMHHMGDHHQQHQQQHGLPSPTHARNPMRLIPPPLPSQAGMSGLVPEPLGSSGAGRGYSPYSHPGSAPPHSPGLSGPLMSPGGQMALVSNMGMPYGSGSGSPGSGPGGGFMSGRGRPLLYSHNSLHTHYPNPHQIGHHHLPGILGGKGHHGPGGPSGIHERPFKCDVCPQSFNRNHDLKRHKRIHLAVKPFPCNYCDKSFSRKDALKRHRLVKGCGERPSDNSSNSMSNAGGLHPPNGSVLSDTTSDGGHDNHGLLR